MKGDDPATFLLCNPIFEGDDSSNIPDRIMIRGRSEELEALAVEMYARGLSTRDIEALFADARGQSLLSRTAVSEITERLWAEYEAFASRDLSEFEVIYLFVDGIAERLSLLTPPILFGLACHR